MQQAESKNDFLGFTIKESNWFFVTLHRQPQLPTGTHTQTTLSMVKSHQKLAGYSGKVLELGNNSFSGNIPDNIFCCSNLMFFGVGYNNLTGKIPPELGSLSKLQILFIRENHLGGSIPPFLGNLTSLQVLSAGYNELEGIIPDTLGNLQSATSFSLGANNLTGTVPLSIYNLSSVTRYSLGSNQLLGNLPPNLFLTLPSIRALQLYGNQFSGPIPISLSNATKLEYLDISQNNLTGKISTNFRGLQHLWMLYLWGNKLGSGEEGDMNFIGSLTNCSNLEMVGLMINRLGGTLPNYIGNLSTKVRFIGLTENQITGEIPSEISNLVNLTHLDMSNNRFIGKIPPELGKLPILRRLFLFGNQLSGKIPVSLGNLSTLTDLYMQNNKLEGAILSSLGNLGQLLLLNLSQNNLSGAIPSEIFELPTLSVSLNLARNQLNGPLPSYVGNLSNLVELDISENRLSGEIPSDLGRCISFVNLYMSSNFFRGPIPPSLSSLRGLQILDISRNSFSGKMPSYFEDFPLKSLNLSFNNFEGEVPSGGVFSNASVVSLTGNSRLCGGLLELKLPKCASTNTKKRKLSRALLIIIPIASSFIGVTLVAYFLIFWLMRRRNKQPQEGSLLKEPHPKVSYQELLLATDGFSSANLIGAGSFGSVYKGILDGTAFAVKVLNLQRRGASKSFTAECEAMRNVRHRNLVKTITSCSSVDFQGYEFKDIVYELMPNGNLERWLHGNSEREHGQEEPPSLDLFQRVNIAIDVALCLEYLHHHCEKPIVHCDLKPSNILLDDNMTAHVGDFGLARILPELTSESQASSVGVRGTVGYAAPEYGIGNEVSTLGDVYSYGVLLLEMVTGKRPTEITFDHGVNLHKVAKMALPDQVMKIVDLRLLSAVTSDKEEDAAPSYKNESHSRSEGRMEDCLTSLVKIGVACSVEAPTERMDISKVVSELHSLRNNLVQIWGPGQN